MRRTSIRQGSALVEFLLSTLFWVPLLLGTIFIGISLTRAIEVTQICRDAGHMHAYGIDFSQPQAQALLIRLANGFDLSRTGSGVVILSTIAMIGPDDCKGAGLNPDTAHCPNLNQAVFTRRIVIGNAALRASDFGAPPAHDLDSSGNINNTYYLNDYSDRAGTFNALLPLTAGQYAYMAEAYFASPDLDWPGFFSSLGTYSRAIF